MPAGYNKCREDGGKIRTVSGPNKEHGLKKGEYVTYCVITRKGKRTSYRGEVHKKKKSSTSKHSSPRKYTKSYYKRAYKKSKKG